MKIITAPELKLEINKEEARGVRKVYLGMLDLLKSPNRWIKGEESRKNYATGINMYCLLGAARKVDGEFEDLAEAFMLFNPPAGWEFDQEFPFPDELTTLNDLAWRGIEEIPEFNDASGTEYKDVTEWLRALIKKTDKIIAA